MNYSRARGLWRAHLGLMSSWMLGKWVRLLTCRLTADVKTLCTPCTARRFSWASAWQVKRETNAPAIATRRTHPNKCSRHCSPPRTSRCSSSRCLSCRNWWCPSMGFAKLRKLGCIRVFLSFLLGRLGAALNNSRRCGIISLSLHSSTAPR